MAGSLRRQNIGVKTRRESWDGWVRVHFPPVLGHNFYDLLEIGIILEHSSKRQPRVRRRS